jgi:protein-disulfide isomerase
MKRHAAILGVALTVVVLAGASPSAGNDDCSIGLQGAPIKIEVFSDFQCPSCRAFYLDTIRPIIQNYARMNKVCLVYYEFPLIQHPLARECSRYAVAARHLGRAQWEQVTEALYSRQAEWSESGKVEWVVAQTLSADDFAKVKQMAHSPEVEQEINREVALATSRGVSSTPTFFVTTNGREQRVVGGVSFEVFKSHIDRNLK